MKRYDKAHPQEFGAITAGAIGIVATLGMLATVNRVLAGVLAAAASLLAVGVAAAVIFRAEDFSLSNIITRFRPAVTTRTAKLRTKLRPGIKELTSVTWNIAVIAAVIKDDLPVRASASDVKYVRNTWLTRFRFYRKVRFYDGSKIVTLRGEKLRKAIEGLQNLTNKEARRTAPTVVRSTKAIAGKKPRQPFKQTNEPNPFPHEHDVSKIGINFGLNPGQQPIDAMQDAAPGNNLKRTFC